MVLLSKEILETLFPKKKYKNIIESKELIFKNKLGERIIIQIVNGKIIIRHDDILNQYLDLFECLTTFQMTKEEYKFIFKAVNKLIKNK